MLLRTTALLALLSTPLSADNHSKRSLALDCIAQAKRAYQMDNARDVVAKGGVTCPAGDIVGFPPKSRKHNRNGTITVAAGTGREICPGTTPEVRNVSTNNGSRGEFSYSSDRSTVSMPISCRGASPGQGRRWYNAELVAQSCPAITDAVELRLTRNCAVKLR
ncbi:MAG: hypothetical protein AAFN94_14605 [Pseudomonadota bacterium]